MGEIESPKKLAPIYFTILRTDMLKENKTVALLTGIKKIMSNLKFSMTNIWIISDINIQISSGS